MAKLNWNKLPNQQEFDRVVEAFFVKENADLGLDAYAVNGRGGDGGIDIHIRRDGRLNIVQLKFFPEGFSGGFRDRKKQILKSFKDALKHEPDEWTLVIPTTLTPAERRYVVELPARQRQALTKPLVTPFDQTLLDALAAKHTDLVTYFSRDELMDAARAYNQEKALLVNQDDLTSRLAVLAKQGDSLDPDWRVDTFTQGDVTGTILVAKHPHAAERSPITLKMSAEFGPEHEELQESFEKFMAYGTPERIDLPDSVVKELRVEGPPAFAKSTRGGEISFIPNPMNHVPRPFTLVFYSGGRRIASFPGTTTWIGAAQIGGSIRLNFSNALNLELHVPFDRAAAVNMSLNICFGGREPSEVARAVTLLEHLHAGYAPAFELEGDEIARMLPAAPGQAVFGDDLPEILEHKSIAEDLIFVQEQTSLYFPYPTAISREDRVYLRCIRLLLEGRCIVMPDYREFNQVLSGQDGEALRTLLTGGPLPIRIQSDGFGFEIFGREIELGELAMYAPQMSVVGSTTIIEALDNGSAEGIPLTLRCADGYGVWAFLPDRHQADPDGKVRPVSLGLEEIPDAPDIARALGAKCLEELGDPKPE